MPEKIIPDYESWKKQAEEVFGSDFYRGEKIKIPAVIKRCPKCHQLTLEYNVKTGRIFCTNCDFEINIPTAKEVFK